MARVCHAFAGFYVPSGALATETGGTKNIYGRAEVSSGGLSSSGGALSVTGAGTVKYNVYYRATDGGAIKAVQWAVINSFNNAADAGEANGFERALATIDSSSANNLQIYAKKVSSTTYNIEIYYDNAAVSAVGATAFLYGTAYHLRLQANGSTLELYFGGSLEVNVASTETLTLPAADVVIVGIYSAAEPSGSSVGPCAVFSGDTTADRPADNCVVSQLILNNNAPHHTDFTLVTSGNKDDNVDDWETGAADDATSVNYDVGTANNTYQQTYKHTSVTVAGVCALQVWTRYRDNTASKTDTISLILCDGSTERYVTLADPDTSFINGAPYLFTKDASNTAWTQTLLDNAQYGLRAAVGGTLVVCEITAVYAEAIGIADDPPGIHSLPHRLDPLRGMIGR